jgi:hypothetical protein
MRTIGWALVGTVLVTGCASKEQGFPTAGTLLSTDGGGRITALRSHDGRLEVRNAVSLEGKFIVGIDGHPDGPILFGACSTSGECAVYRLDLATGSVVTVADGKLPSVSEDDRSFSFFKDSGDGLGEFIQRRFDTNPRATSSDIVLIPNVVATRRLSNGVVTPTIARPVVMASDVLVIGDGTGMLYRVAPPHTTRAKLPSPQCIPLAHRPKTDELLCVDLDWHNPFLLNTITGNVVPLGTPENASAFTFVGKNLLVFCRTSIANDRERYDVVYRDMTEGVDRVLMANQYMAAGVWLPEEAVGR